MTPAYSMPVSLAISECQVQMSSLLKLGEVVVSTASSHRLHQSVRGVEEARYSIGRLVDIDEFAEFGILSGDTGGALVGVADAGSDAADRLDGRVGESYAICS